ncbi:MAG: hypothetical protein E7256_00735 [Lachnospiraceae bacterium]|nr:hypothetical protein [Lachnospiraceae bacterium]
MAISPVELLSMAPKSQEASFVRQHEVQKPVHEQIQIMEKVSQEVKHNAESVIKMGKTDNPEYRYDTDRRGNNPFFGQQKKKKKKDGKEDKEEKKKSLSSTIDIRI